MRSYGQYCPISRASEILAERWTMLVLRNLLLGCTTFTEIAGGVPGMSRSLLSSRLKALDEQGIVASTPKARGRGRTYALTEAGHDLWGVIESLSAWGRRWIELQPEHSDPSFVLWAWIHVHLRRDALPRRRVVVRFDFPDEPASHRRFWFLIDHGEAELCYSHPGSEADLRVTARSRPFTLWHVGRLSWQRALRTGGIRVEGPRSLVRALPTWNERAGAVA
ncbi:MAG: helix-turn-helix domain-containing protein [Polyangiaceae bacterium]